MDVIDFCKEKPGMCQLAQFMFTTYSSCYTLLYACPKSIWEEKRLNRTNWQKVESWNTWQYIKRAKLYSNLSHAWKRKPLLALASEQRVTSACAVPQCREKRDQKVFVFWGEGVRGGESTLCVLLALYCTMTSDRT